jgi:lysophospholipase
MRENSEIINNEVVKNEMVNNEMIDNEVVNNNVINNEIIKHDMIFLGEEDYMEKIIHVVGPRLDDLRKKGYYQSVDGAEIYYEYYDNPKEKAAIVISHGFCEFTQKFEEVIFYYIQAGYSVYIPDHRGHGYSQRAVENWSKVYIRTYDDYVMDFHQFITSIVLKDNVDRKLVLYAHSMGGAIAALFLEQYPDIFSSAILSSPMLEIECGKTPTPLVWLAMLYKKITRTGEDYVSGHGDFDGIPHFDTSTCLSRARYHHIFNMRLQDIKYQTWGATCAWTLASLKAVRKLQKRVKQVKTPILLFQAGRDTTVKPGGQKRFAQKSMNTRLVEFSDSKHEIYNATTEIRKEYYHMIFAYLEEQFAVESQK